MAGNDPNANHALLAISAEVTEHHHIAGHIAALLIFIGVGAWFGTRAFTRRLSA